MEGVWGELVWGGAAVSGGAVAADVAVGRSDVSDVAAHDGRSAKVVGDGRPGAVADETSCDHSGEMVRLGRPRAARPAAEEGCEGGGCEA